MENNIENTTEQLQDDEELLLAHRSYFLEVLIAIMLFLILLVFFWNRIFVSIPAGHKGVLFQPLFGGTVTNRYYDEGLAFVFPWDKMIIYDTRVLSGQDSIKALTQDGISVHTEISYRYRPTFDSLGLIHKNLGLDYPNKVLVPQITAATRDVISRYRIDALYTVSRDFVQNEMLTEVKRQVDSVYPITVLDLVIRNITLDSTVERAIAYKLVKEQELLGYKYVVRRESLEMDRKLIEARGIKMFQDTSRISIMQWRAIDATKELAKSPNAKIVVIGKNSSELPLILGGN